MNLSILNPSPSSSSHPAVVFSHFTNTTSLQLSTTKPSNSLTRKHRRNRLRYQISAVRCSASTSSDQTPPNFVTSDVFGGKKELTGIQALVAAMSPPVRLAGSALIFSVAVAAGYSLGLRFGGIRNAAAVGGAVVLGAAGAGAAYALNSCAPEVAAVNLHNYVAGSDDPAALK